MQKPDEPCQLLGMKLFVLNRLGFVHSVMVVSGALALGACGSSDGSLEADDATAAELEEQGVMARQAERGPLGLVEIALREDIGLSEAQRTTLESLRAPGERGPHGPPREHVAALAAAVRAGSIDADALSPEGSGRDEMHKHFASAIDTLHDTLSATQRAKLVKLARERASEEAGERRGPPPGALRGPGSGFPLLPGVELTDAQRQKVEAALSAKGITRPGPPAESEMDAHRADMEAARDKLLERFLADDFDAASALPPPPPRKGGFLDVLAVAVPLLDATQREALAVALEQGPPGPSGRRGPPPGNEE